MVYVADMVSLDSLILSTGSSTSERGQGVMRERDYFAMAIEVDSAVLVIFDRVRNWHQERCLGVDSTMQVEDLL